MHRIRILLKLVPNKQSGIFQCLISLMWNTQTSNRDMIDFSELPENCASTTLGFGHFAIELPKRKRNTAHLIEKYLVHRDSRKYAYSNHRIPDCLSEATVSIYLSQNPRSFYTYHRIPKVYPAEKQHVPKKLMVGSDVISFQKWSLCRGHSWNFRGFLWDDGSQKWWNSQTNR